jgi:hypothetical protein
MCPGFGNACAECESAACPAEYCACFNNQSCVNMAQCTLGCLPTDIACNQPCWTANPEGISVGALLAHCAATLCSQACPGYQPLTPCQKCLYESCPAAMNVCIANPDCTLLLFCLGCQTPGCQNACYAMYPGGVTDAGPVATCAQGQCAAACGIP